MAIITPQGHYLGWKRPLPGRGALEQLPHADTTNLAVLPQVDPRKKMPPAVNQLALGSCTANATGRAFRYDTIQDGKDCGELSRLWIYYFERSIEHTLDQGDCGAEGHDAFTVAKHGIPAETLWPYDISKFEQKPPACWIPGHSGKRDYTLTKPVHAVPQNETAFKQVLSNNQTIAYGFTVYRDFEEPWSIPGVMPEPNSSEEVLGGHENLLVGYLEEYPDHFLSLNSWGTSWGVFGGYFLFPKATILDSNMATDFRTIVRTVA